MHEAFAKFLSIQESLRGGAAPFTILYQMVTHRAVDRLRRRSRWTGRLLPHENDDGPKTAEMRLEMLMADAGGLSRVEAAQNLALLTQGEEEQVVTAAFLYFADGLSAKQVGQVLNLHPRKVTKILEQFVKRAKARQARIDAEVSP
ncbi:RNA polymerase sigma-70 factor (ECF subfamily) [Archangium gephyra]|uniref:RNA polymerase sigma-70 factor (ECF subfamily) n=2 Tax=Archangium gephyra TaxID=48 RepID=A0ABX9JK72_9BACT|nr:RNA polymerase sigma-70 factor (ECF subfamily) [Archangium gephyra]